MIEQNLATVHMQRVVTAQEMAAMEAVVMAHGVTVDELMGRAGSGAARHLRAWLGGLARRPVVVLCGPGKNGGDGLLMARALDRSEATVAAYTVGRPLDDPALGPFRRYRAEDDTDLMRLRNLVDRAAVIVDALLGTGQSRPIDGLMARVLRHVVPISSERTIVALDLPSGVDPDSGSVDPATVPADLTLTFGYAKRGLLLQPGASYGGAIVTIDIGLPTHLGESIAVSYPDSDDIAAMLPHRSTTAHKYTAGAVLVVAGSPSFPGAPRLAALGAYRAGAGLVTVATGTETHPLIAPTLLEATFLPLPTVATGGLDPNNAERLMSILPRYRSVLIGPGLGQDRTTQEVIVRFLTALRTQQHRQGLATIIDADGLNMLATRPRWWDQLPPDTILTPHEGELSRLRSGTAEADPAPGQADRIEVARAAARHWNVVIVAKGAPSIIASPNGQVVINPVGGPNLATAGTGDVLAGVIASLAAQHMPVYHAAIAGCYIHGSVGDRVARQMGDRGMLASDLLPIIPQYIHQLLADGHPAAYASVSE